MSAVCRFPPYNSLTHATKTSQKSSKCCSDIKYDLHRVKIGSDVFSQVYQLFYLAMKNANLVNILADFEIEVNNWMRLGAYLLYEYLVGTYCGVIFWIYHVKEWNSPNLQTSMINYTFPNVQINFILGVSHI